MSDLSATQVSVTLTERRRRRIERELRALHAMASHLRIRDIVVAIAAIPALALLCFLVTVKLHFFSGSVPLSVASASAVGILIWWIGRRWFLMSCLIVYGLFLILFESAPDYVDFTVSDKKLKRRIKLQNAIAKREALLAQMDRVKP